jgi:hypothetical protein
MRQAGWRGDRNSKIHALADKFCRPWVVILKPGNVADCRRRRSA